MSENGITRVQYFDQQFLRKQEFEAEQAYHLSMRRRHNIAHHTWGIVCGLEVVIEENAPFVTPGMAVDGYGREIVLAEKQPLSTRAFDEKDSDELDVWIAYDRTGSDKAPKGYASCKNGDEDSYYRWQERPLLYLQTPDPAYLNRRRPESVPEGDWQFPPYRTPPDDPNNDWPIFLGQIRQAGEAPEFEYTAVPGDRPYVGLKGEQISSPSGRSHVQIGAEQVDDQRRFAVSTWDIPNNRLARRLQINREGQVDIYQKTTVHGDVTIAGGSVEFGVGQANGDPERPWRIYRYVTPASGNGSPTLTQNELRIEMAGGGNNAVVIGFWSTEANAFVPCLTINDDCSVQIHGNLFVQGEIRANKVPSAVPFDPDAQNLAKAAMLSGMGGASTLLDRFYRSPYSSDLEIVAGLLDDDAGRAQVAGVLLENPARAENFLIIVLGEQAGRDALQVALAGDETRYKNFMGVVLDSSDGRTAIIAALGEDLSRRETFSAAFIADNDSREAVVISLLSTTAGRQAIVQNLATSPQLNAFTDQLATVEDTREAAALSLLERSEGRQAIVNSLDNDVTASDLDDFTDRLTGNATTRASTITNLLEIPAARRSIADRLLDDPDGRQAIAESMNTVATRMTDFADLLKDDFPTLASNLAAALTS